MVKKRRVDLSASAKDKLLRCEKFLETVSTEYYPESCLKMMKRVCEVRNKALQKHMKHLAEQQIGDAYYERNVIRDMSLFMRCIRRKIGKLTPDFSAVELYYQQQRQIFKHLKPVRRGSCRDTMMPGKTGYNQAGIYNGLAWVLLCLDTAVKFDENTKASTLQSYFQQFLSTTRGQYIGERLCVSLRKLTIGIKYVAWADRKKVKATIVMVDDIWRRKTSLQAYGALVCSHLEDTSFKFIRCPEKGCLLFTIVQITKRIIHDLLKLALRNTRMNKAPPRGDQSKAAISYWKRELARYLLFAIQEARLIRLRPKYEKNLLYQIGYPEDLSLSRIVDVNGKDILNNLPYWLIIPRLSAKQLTVLAVEHGIEIPESCTGTRQALEKVVFKTYDKWDEVLANDETTLTELLETFDHVEDFSFNLINGKKEIRRFIKPIKTGNEILMLQLTTDSTGFCPTLKRVPGPTIHKNMITSWLHDCSLLHVATKEDPRPTRVFSDTDCRTHCLHLRRDSGDKLLDLCKQLGWKPPPVYSDSGSTVYRRGDAVVKSPEYNTNFISWLQMMYDGRIAAIPGFNYRSVVENSRIRYKQLQKLMKTNQRAEVKNILDSCIHEYFEGLESKLQMQTNQLNELEAKIDKKFDRFKKDILDAISQSLKSADDVHQNVATRVKRRKKRSFSQL